MYACVCTRDGRELYTSFFKTAEEATTYAERMPGVIRVEKAHAGEPPVWVRGA